MLTLCWPLFVSYRAKISIFRLLQSQAKEAVYFELWARDYSEEKWKMKGDIGEGKGQGYSSYQFWIFLEGRRLIDGGIDEPIWRSWLHERWSRCPSHLLQSERKRGLEINVAYKNQCHHFFFFKFIEFSKYFSTEKKWNLTQKQDCACFQISRARARKISAAGRSLLKARAFDIPLCCRDFTGASAAKFRQIHPHLVLGNHFEVHLHFHYLGNHFEVHFHFHYRYQLGSGLLGEEDCWNSGWRRLRGTVGRAAAAVEMSGLKRYHSFFFQFSEDIKRKKLRFCLVV